MKYKASNYKYYRIEGVFEIPRWWGADQLTLLLVAFIEKLGGYAPARFVEVKKNGKVKHVEEE